AAAQPLAVAILVKTSCEVTAPVAGRVARILVAAQETFGRGRVLAEIEEAEAAHAGAARPPAAGAAPPAPAGAAGPDAARADRGVRRTPLAGLRGVVARSLTAAWQGAPRVAVAVEVDMTASLARPAALARQLGASPRVSVTHLVLRAAALSLREHPRLNGRVAGDAVETSDAVHVGLAVDVDEAVVVPVVRDADRKSAAERAALAAAARAGRLAPAAAQGGTFTVSTLGAAGADWFTPILNAPQIAILGVGAVAPRPVVRGNAVVAAPTVHLTLVFDHRAVDGVPAARFLAAVRARLESAADL